MANFIIRSIKAGFGVTILPKEPGGNVLKYYIEPEIHMEVPASGSAEELQATLDNLTEEVITMLQNSVKKKAIADKEKKKKDE